MVAASSSIRSRAAILFGPATQRGIFRVRAVALVGLVLTASLHGQAADAPRAPNVVLIITDDQGYPDLGCHGNPVLKTPALDALFADSVRLANFHVDPTCAPTRSALMTGRYSSRTGVWHTTSGRSFLRRDEVTLANLFATGGYRTGMFGKWHLGDNFPYRPHDRGFQTAVYHGGGGVAQIPDAWGNDYFDDVYQRNGKPEKFEGYCTDVWFREATRFIEENRERPFFCYVATNAPHDPYLVDEKYSRPYKEAGVPSPRAEFYGMIANVDENIGRLRAKLKELGLAENTLFVYMTDNGTAAGVDANGGYGAGMRAKKGSEYDGGHRVPCFLHWPAGKLTGGRDIAPLTAHIDLFPTFAEMCRLKPSESKAGPIDGKSLVPLVAASDQKPADSSSLPPAWPARTLFVHSQRIEHPEKWRQSAVMTDRWRLVNGKELFDVAADPGQTKEIAAAHPEVVAQLRKEYDGWWESISTRFDEYCRIDLGAEPADPVELTCHDWHPPPGPVAAYQRALPDDPVMNGWWAVDVVRGGEYELTLRLRPAGVKHALRGKTARVECGKASASVDIAEGADEARLKLRLEAGPAKLQTWLEGDGDKARGAYFVTVRRIGP